MYFSWIDDENETMNDASDATIGNMIANGDDINFKVEHKDGSIEEILVEPKKQKGQSKMLEKMKVYAFVGTSGSGKSHRAQMVAKEYGLNYIIIDILYIYLVFIKK